MTPEEARAVLVALGAPERLVRHGGLVLEAAEALIGEVELRGVAIDADFVRAGAVLHDAGKTQFPKEMSVSGSEHEAAGEKLLLSAGVEPRVARCCVSHAQWASMACSLEELLVALSDKLWKGVRHTELEQRVIAELASKLRVDTWDVFVPLDTCFEAIAAAGPDRLRRSRV